MACEDFPMYPDVLENGIGEVGECWFWEMFLYRNFNGNLNEYLQQCCLVWGLKSPRTFILGVRKV